MNDMTSKATKADLLHVSNILSTLPQVHDELENLKSFVNEELTTRADYFQNKAIDKKTVNKLLNKKLRALQEEVLLVAQPKDCNSCGTRSGLQPGSYCISCATPVKVIDREFAPSRGGGFVINAAPKSKEDIRPRSAFLGVGRGFSNGATSTGSIQARAETGADGKIYHHQRPAQPGSRTQRVQAAVESPRGSTPTLWTEEEGQDRAGSISPYSVYSTDQLEGGVSTGETDRRQPAPPLRAQTARPSARASSHQSHS
jgi:hypothetical protein